MRGNGIERSLEILFGVGRAQFCGALHRVAGGNVTVQRIMSGGLVSEQIRRHATTHHLRQHLGAIPHQADRDRTFGVHRIVERE